ncbi:MAG: efflux RND transporter permease subunit [Proteobacteria bacterium]|nr:efflux RND transporter permease subunit [Pseudomonadota bacterium]
MNLSAPFIKRPIGTTLLAIGLAIAGAIAFKLLPVAPLPQVEFPTIMVQAALPGANPETMATSVATPLERQLGWIAGVTEMTSSSSLGTTRIVIQFDLSRNIDGAARDVQAAINAARNNLPTNLPNNPTYRKVNPADAPIMVIALTSNIYSTGQMYDVGSSFLAQKLSQVNGIGQVNVGGSSLPAVRIELNPSALNKYGIGFSDVNSAISSANVNRPKGQINHGVTTSEIVTNDQIFKAYQYRPLIIAYRNGNPVKVSDVAEVNDSVEDVHNAGFSNGKPAVLLVLFKQPGANVIETVDQVKALFPQLKASIPAAIDMTVVMDRTSTIRSSLSDVELTLILAMLLVIAVTFVFLGNIRSMLIPGVAVPLSLLGTFGVMRLLGYSLDNFSLMALTISTGFVVDDAVVVLENITRHIEMGVRPMQAALQGAKEVSFTVVSMSTSLIAVFIPLLFMSGLIGRLLHEFAVTLSVAVFISMIVSLTVTPMMCAQLLKENGNHVENKKPNRYKQIIHHLWGKYQISLDWALHRPKLMMSITVGAVVFSIILFIYAPRGFFPQQDTGRLMGSIQADQNISFEALQEKLIGYINIIRKDLAVEHVVGFIGGSGSNATTNSGTIFVSLKPLSERKFSADDVVNRLRDKLKRITGATLYLQAAQDLVIGGRQAAAQFQYTLSANNLEDLNAWAPRIMKEFLKLPGIADVNSDQLNHGLQTFVKVDRDTASRFGITSRQIDNTLYNAYGQAQISIMYTPMNQYHVVMEAAPNYSSTPDVLDMLYLRAPLPSTPSSSGTSIASTIQEVPLSAFAKFENSSTLLTVNHLNQAPATTLSFNLLPGAVLGDAVNAVSQSVSDMHLPATLYGSFQGTAQAFQASLTTMPYLIIMALIAVYIVLGILYENLIHPITIFSTLPSAGVGALLALMLTGTELNIVALIGIILLIGIVKKNAIMMIDFALEAERTENKSPREAIYEAALLRFRPIMMTTMAAMLGACPLAFGYGIGAELRRPLGIAIIGGLFVSQMLTLYTTPVIYLELENFRKWFLEQKKKFRMGQKHIGSNEALNP